MKNILILIVFTAIFLHFYPQPKLNDWFDEKKEQVMTAFSKATDTKVRLNSEKIFSDLTDEFKTFSPEEVSFVKEITKSREKVEQFYTKYCGDKKKYNANLRSNHLETVCQQIQHYQSLF